MLVAMSPNKQLERTVIRRHGRAACASFHCALAPRITRPRAAAELRRRRHGKRSMSIFI
jgi:hypothetical protein